MNLMEYSAKEIEVLKLLKELQDVLNVAVIALGGMRPKTPERSYLGFVANAVKNIADGYLVLRNEGRLTASKLLVRPAIELILNGTAVEKKPGLLVRKAYSEWEAEGKMYKGTQFEAKHDQRWQDFKKRVKIVDPNCQIVRKRLTIRETAQLASMDKIYDVAYGIYCRFTHGAFDAVQGNLDGVTNDRDSQVMTYCVIQAISLLERSTPAAIPDYDLPEERLDRLIFGELK